MKQFIQRLKLINLAIELNEYDIIDTQKEKLYAYKHEYETKKILNLLENRLYEQAKLKIKDYINNFKKLHFNEQIDTDLLKFKLKSKQLQIYNLLEKKRHYAFLLNQFYILFHTYLTPLIDEILQKKFQNISHVYKNDKTYSSQYNFTQNLYQNFKSTYEKLQNNNLITFSDDEKQELKKLYASSYISEDKVKQLCEQSQIIQKNISIAYKDQDLDALNKIQSSMKNLPQNLEEFANIHDTLELKKQENNLNKQINEVKNELEMFEKSEIFFIIKSSNNLEKYFIDFKQNLSNKKDKLINT